MRITKYNQSCFLIETNKKRILIDPGNIGYDESLLNEWNNIDIILVTHRHSDHCNVLAINEIIKRDNARIYTTDEVVKNKDLINPFVIKQADVIDLKNIKIEVTKAVHGFLPTMKEKGAEIIENVGYIIDDGSKRIYFTSDTICFNNNYKCDVLCMPFNGNGLTMGIIDGVMFAKEINPKLLIPSHMEMALPFMNPDLKRLKDELEESKINYKILDLKETIEI